MGLGSMFLGDEKPQEKPEEKAEAPWTDEERRHAWKVLQHGRNFSDGGPVIIEGDVAAILANIQAEEALKAAHPLVTYEPGPLVMPIGPVNEAIMRDVMAGKWSISQSEVDKAKYLEARTKLGDLAALIREGAHPFDIIPENQRAMMYHILLGTAKIASSTEPPKGKQMRIKPKSFKGSKQARQAARRQKKGRRG